MFYVPSPTSDSFRRESVEIYNTKETSPKYEEELQILRDKDLDSIKSYAVSGNLRLSALRSLYWRILLGVVPASYIHWLPSFRDLRRRYDEMKRELILDPHRTSYIPNDNPLSQDENSIWYRYFCDEELKRVIRQDVIRTSPEKQFFQLDSIQEIMTNVLFVYARRNPNMCYRQGMHELLASTLYVIHEDCQTFMAYKSLIEIESVLSEILDLKYLEHDVFHLFDNIMKRMSMFYESDSSCVPNSCGHFSELPSGSKPRIYDEKRVSGISVYINTVIKNNLAVHDPLLYLHMKKLNIPFTAFGIRWLRLLFGREFAFADLFVLWDAIFALDSNFFLVNHILIAMLIIIRDKLLYNEYVDCLNYLMKYPKIIDVTYIVKLALHLQEPSVYRRPSLPVMKSESENEKTSSNKNNNKPKTSASSTKRQRNHKFSFLKKISEKNSADLEEYSSKNFEMAISELKHIRVVMSLCKLKLYQYHDILSASVDVDDIKAQHALTGIHELCTLLDIDHFSIKSSQISNSDVETAREAGEITPFSQKDENVSHIHATEDAIALYLPPPKSEIDMTMFRRTERAFADFTHYPLESPHKPKIREQ